MYAIGNIIYGFPISEDLYSKIEKKLGEDWEEEFRDTPGFLTWYSGSGVRPCAIGVELDSIDECEEVNLAELMGQLSSIEDDKLNFEIPEKLKKFFEGMFPNLWIVWSTS